MIAGTWRSLTPASQIASTARPKASGGKSSLSRRRVMTNAMRRCAMRSAPPIAATSVAESAAAANKAAQICTVCP